ncbi:hypothetical protein JL722_821 [Aureococcus anophagefferens]|nr:hypothetical protein JL722_821 [Aureococcus anophagefferens]
MGDASELRGDTSETLDSGVSSSNVALGAGQDHEDALTAQQALWEAAAAGGIAALQAALETDGVDVDAARPADGMPALHLAAQKGSDACARACSSGRRGAGQRRGPVHELRRSTRGAFEREVGFDKVAGDGDEAKEKEMEEDPIMAEFRRQAAAKKESGANVDEKRALDDLKTAEGKIDALDAKADEFRAVADMRELALVSIFSRSHDLEQSIAELTKRLRASPSGPKLIESLENLRRQRHPRPKRARTGRGAAAELLDENRATLPAWAPPPPQPVYARDDDEPPPPKKTADRFELMKRLERSYDDKARAYAKKSAPVPEDVQRARREPEARPRRVLPMQELTFLRPAEAPSIPVTFAAPPATRVSPARAPDDLDAVRRGARAARAASLAAADEPSSGRVGAPPDAETWARQAADRAKSAASAADAGLRGARRRVREPPRAAVAASASLIAAAAAPPGDVIAVGASYKDGGRGTQAGSAFVFRTTDGGETWTQAAEIVGDDVGAYDHFGRSIDVDGDTLVVGAPFDDDVIANAGAAYVFRTTDGGASWSQEAKLTEDDSATDDSAVQDENGIITLTLGVTIGVGHSDPFDAPPTMDANSRVCLMLDTTDEDKESYVAFLKTATVRNLDSGLEYALVQNRKFGQSAPGYKHAGPGSTTPTRTSRS